MRLLFRTRAPLAAAMLCLALWFAGVLAPPEARAGSPTCTITASNVAFGNVDVLAGTAVDVTGSFSVNCSGGSGNGHTLCISIGSGANFSGSQRHLAGPNGSTLSYELYKDAARSTVWGSWQTGFAGTGLQVRIPQNTTISVPVYARLFGSQQTAEVGSYSSSFTLQPYMQYADGNTATCPTGNWSATSSFTVSASVLATCTISATDLNFGATSVITSNVDSSSQLTPRCNNGLPYTIALNGGSSSAINPASRKMTKGADQITYGLYRDAARSLPWGSTTGSNTAAGTGTGSNQSVPVYGRVPPQATGSPGSYTDTIIASVTY
jgi:spore coat protein U-like protein